MGGRETHSTRSPWGLVSAAVLGVLVLGACSGEGISLPTVSRSGDTIVLPSVSVPSVSLPSLTRSPQPSGSPTPESSPDPTPQESTEEPEPTTAPPPTETVTTTPTPEPAPTPTETVAVQPIATPSPTTTADAAPAPEDVEDTSRSPWIWLLAAAALAAALAAFLVPRSRRRAAWTAELAQAESDSSWFAGVLLPQLQQTPSPDALAGGWRVGGAARVAGLEDRLAELAASAPDPHGTTRARELRDAVRDARLGVEGLIASGGGTASAQVLGSLASSLTAVIDRGSPAARS